MAENCSLCGREISRYSQELNHLEIDESHSADLCQDCIDRFIRWQGKVISRLFPTKVMKKRYG